MPLYDYQCPAGHRQEVQHAMGTSPEVLCAVCQQPMRRQFSVPHIARGNSGLKAEVTDLVRRRREQKQELRDKYNVHDLHPLRRGESFDSVYRSIKQQGAFVKELMAGRVERTAKEQRQKQKAWAEGAARRAPAARRKIAEQRQAEAAAKRAVRLA